MAKFGQLFLQKGNWKGQQVLPAAWVEEASTLKVVQHPEITQAKRDSSDWEQGYCYQMWRCRHNAFRADGAFGQFIVVMPDQDAVVVITGESSDLQGELNLVWKYLLPAMQKDKLPSNRNAAPLLQQKLSALALPLYEKSAPSATETAISGKTYSLTPNEKSIQNITFQFSADVCRVSMQTDTAVAQLFFGAGKWIPTETAKRGPYYVAAAKASLVGLPPFKVAGSYRWKDENTLELTLRYIESPHTETFTCHFEQEGISIEYQHSLDKSKTLIFRGK